MFTLRFQVLVAACLVNALGASSAFALEDWNFNTLSGNYVTSNTVREVHSERALFVVHPATMWDGARSSQNGVQTLVQTTLDANRNNGANIPVFEFIDDLANLSHYFWTKPEGLTRVISIAGQHAIRLDGTKTLYLSGGVFEYCMCRAMRDVLLNFDFSKSPNLKINFVEDAIYVSNGYTDPKWAIPSSANTDLKSFTSRMSNGDFFAFIQARYFGDHISGLCQPYTDQVFPALPLSKSLSFEILRDGNSLGKIGAVDSSYSIQINFISLSEYEKELSP